MRLQQKPGRKVWTVNFNDCKGHRVCRSLGNNRLLAEKYRDDIMYLIAGARDPGHRLNAAIWPVSFKAFYNEDKEQYFCPKKEIKGLLGRYADLLAGQVAVNKLLKEHEDKSLALAADFPGNEALLLAYDKSLHALEDKTRKANVRWAEKLIDFCEDLPVYDIGSSEILDFLEQESMGNNHAAKRYNRVRVLVGRFFSFLEKKYYLNNPMHKIDRLKAGADDDITWMDGEQVAKFCAGDYGAAQRVALYLMLFAGLRSKEVRGLRCEDIEDDFIRVTPNAFRRLKTVGSRRNVAIHTNLRSILFAQKKKGINGWLFPGSAGGIMNEADWQRWISADLPSDCDCRLLRRTFGSLMLRSGLSAEQVAAAMGNSAAIVKKHYARIEGAEVRVVF